MPHQSPVDSMLFGLDVAAQIASAGVNGSAIDMSGWSGCLYVFNLGAMASGGTFDARVVSSANSNMSGNANITNAALVQVANTANTNLWVLDVWRPTDRYIKLITTPATANTTYSVTTVRYGRTGTNPPTQTATVVKVASN